MNCSEFSSMLDLYIDGELNDAERAALEAHAQQCGECREKLAASEQLRDILSHIDEEIAVPLPAQAAWRNAVRAEAKRRRMKKIYSFCGAAAAVCVLTIGVTAMLRPGMHVQPVSDVQVETDGVSENLPLSGAEPQMAMMLRSVDADAAEYIERTVAAENVEVACGYLMDVVAEYGGTVEHETDSEQSRKVYIQVPGENAADFISAADAIGVPVDEVVPDVDEAAASVGICVMIIPA